MSLEVSAEVVG